MKITPRFPGNIPLVLVVYKYNSRNILVFIATEGYGSAEPGVSYLFCVPDSYSNIYIFHGVFTPFICRYFNACNTIENHNRMRNYDLVIDKH